MNKNQVTCIQNVRFIFNLFENHELLSEEFSLRDINDKNKAITHESIRNLSNFLSNRLSRIADMIEILQSSHNEWIITRRKYKIIVETNTFDFNYALTALKNKGFTDDEYVLKVEYERKWGTL